MTKELKLPDIEMVPIAKIATPGYQRSVHRRRVTEMAERFDPNAFGPLRLSARDGRLYCYDGQHRLAAAEIAGYEMVPAFIIHDATEADEAGAAANITEGTRRHGLADLHRLRVLSADPRHDDSKHIERVVVGAGFTLRASQINTIPAGVIYKAYKECGADTVEQALIIVSEAAWGVDPHARGAHIIMALAKLASDHNLTNDQIKRLRAANFDPKATVEAARVLYRARRLPCVWAGVYERMRSAAGIESRRAVKV